MVASRRGRMHAMRTHGHALAWGLPRRGCMLRDGWETKSSLPVRGNCWAAAGRSRRVGQPWVQNMPVHMQRGGDDRAGARPSVLVLVLVLVAQQRGERIPRPRRRARARVLALRPRRVVVDARDRVLATPRRAKLSRAHRRARRAVSSSAPALRRARIRARRTARTRRRASHRIASHRIAPCRSRAPRRARPR